MNLGKKMVADFMRFYNEWSMSLLTVRPKLFYWLFVFKLILKKFTFSIT
jgi:hypothetical protein